jgi:hypothetical protein
MLTMKVQRHIIFILLITGFIYSSVAYSQTNPPSPTCVICGGKNGVHATTCRYYNPPAGKMKSMGSSQGNIQQLNTLIDLFNTPIVSKEDEARKEKAVKEAREAKLREDNLRQERHEREMKTFKSLDDPKAVRSDNQSLSGLSLKPLPSDNAPMTKEERERQNLLKQRSSVTWNYDEFSAVSSGSQIPEPTPAAELSENEKLVNDMIGMVESNGGRLAAIGGRYIINVKDGVMSYLDDATYAVTSGNSYLMQEAADFEVKKIATNALYKAAAQTGKIYLENAKESVIGGLKDESIGVMKNAVTNNLDQYKYSDNLARAWKQTH